MNFVILERGLTAAEFAITPRHADVQLLAGNNATHVWLYNNVVPPLEVALLKADRVSRHRAIELPANEPSMLLIVRNRGFLHATRDRRISAPQHSRYDHP